MGRHVGIVGVGQTNHSRRRMDVNQAGLVREAVDRALADARLTIEDIDSIVVATGPVLFAAVNVARKAGVQGVVRLQVRLKTDGTLVVEKVLEGEPALVDAATTAVRQWRLNPEEWDGKKVDVISTVTFNFQLR